MLYYLMFIGKNKTMIDDRVIELIWWRQTATKRSTKHNHRRKLLFFFYFFNFINHTNVVNSIKKNFNRYYNDMKHTMFLNTLQCYNILIAMKILRIIR